MTPDSLRMQLVRTICTLPDDMLPHAVEALRRLEIGTVSVTPIAPAPMRTSAPKEWPHAPLHRLNENGTYIVTTGTYGRAHPFHGAERLTLLENNLLSLARSYDWQLEAWAVFSNHYHFVGHTLGSPSRLREFLTELHANTARDLNRLDMASDRKVWHNFWDKQLTFEKSYLARLNYVHQNAVRHKLVPVASQYPWCSAAWFERTATPAQVKTIYAFKTDNLKIADDFTPLLIL